MNEKMGQGAPSINWFEIPATDLARAKQFYDTIFGIDMELMDMEGVSMAMFPVGQGGEMHVTGCLIKGEYFTPGATGTTVYLNANPDMQPILDKVAAAGGSIIMPKMEIGSGYGYMAMITDTEGNKVGLHSMA